MHWLYIVTSKVKDHYQFESFVNFLKTACICLNTFHMWNLLFHWQSEGPLSFWLFFSTFWKSFIYRGCQSNLTLNRYLDMGFWLLLEKNVLGSNNWNLSTLKTASEVLWKITKNNKKQFFSYFDDTIPLRHKKVFSWRKKF